MVLDDDGRQKLTLCFDLQENKMRRAGHSKRDDLIICDTRAGGACACVCWCQCEAQTFVVSKMNVVTCTTTTRPHHTTVRFGRWKLYRYGQKSLLCILLFFFFFFWCRGEGWKHISCQARDKLQNHVTVTNPRFGSDRFGLDRLLS